MARHEHRFADTEAIVTFRPVSPRDAAAYIENMCEELSHLAHRSDLRFLHYLLEVAREEAATQVERHGGDRGEHDGDREKMV